jgi:hypothetical protein
MQGQSELHDRAARFIRRNPYASPVSLNNRTGDRQAHAQTSRFGGHKRLKYRTHFIGGYPNSVVGNSHQR